MGLLCLSNDKKIKHISELTAEELLAQLEVADDSEVDLLQNTQIIQTPLLDFIKKFNIENGKFPVPAKCLVTLYRKTTNDARISELSFINQLRMYFRIVDKMVYINKSAFHFQTELEKHLNKKRRNPLTTESFTKHILKFLDDTGIKKGTVPVPCLVIYHGYREYCIRKKRMPVAKMNFFLIGDKLWQRTTTQYGECYLVNNKGDLYHVKEYETIKKKYERKERTRFKKRTGKKSNKTQ